MSRFNLDRGQLEADVYFLNAYFQKLMLKNKSMRLAKKVEKTVEKDNKPKRALTGKDIMMPTGMTKVIRERTGSV